MERRLNRGLCRRAARSTPPPSAAATALFSSRSTWDREGALAQEAGCKPIISVYDDGDIDNAGASRRERLLLAKPYYWLILPALRRVAARCTNRADGRRFAAHGARQRDIERLLHPGGARRRSSTYLATFAAFWECTSGVGWRHAVAVAAPRRDDQRNVYTFLQMKQIASLLGRSLMTPAEYRQAIGMPARTPSAQEQAVADFPAR